MDLLERCKRGELKGREPLLQLEQRGSFVFHGSPFKLEKLEPRQPYTLNKEKRKMVEDGKPAIVATPLVEVAIFRALINGHNCPKNHRSGFSLMSSGLNFRATQSTLDQAKDAKGYVHVLDKKDLDVHSPMEHRSARKIIPICSVEVGFEDLPKEIDVLTRKMDRRTFTKRAGY